MRWIMGPQRRSLSPGLLVAVMSGCRRNRRSEAPALMISVRDGWSRGRRLAIPIMVSSRAMHSSAVAVRMPFMRSKMPQRSPYTAVVTGLLSLMAAFLRLFRMWRQHRWILPRTAGYTP